MSGFYSKTEQKKLGLKRIGRDCKISKLSRFISKDIIIGDRCRIDDDVVFKGKIQLGNNIHIARGCTLSGVKKELLLLILQHYQISFRYLHQLITIHQTLFHQLL